MTTSRRRKLIGLLLLTALAGSLASGAVHELGHAVAATLMGNKVSEISLFWIFGPPHVHYSGQLNPTSVAVISLAGMLASVLCGVVVLMLVPFRRLPAGWAVASALTGALMVSQSLAWAILPVMVTLGARPQDDVIHFMNSAGWSPAATELLGLSLIGTGAALFFWRTGFLGRVREFKNAEDLSRVVVITKSQEGASR